MGEESETIDLSTEGFTAVEHPGPSFRPVPAFTFDIPPGWVLQEFPGALCVIGTPATHEEPWSNVFVQHERVLATTALEDIAAEALAELEDDFPDVEVIGERVIGFDLFHYVREAELTMDGQRVTRVDSFFFGPDVDHPTVDLFHVMAMHPVAAGDERTITYMKILGSFTFPGS